MFMFPGYSGAKMGAGVETAMKRVLAAVALALLAMACGQSDVRAQSEPRAATAPAPAPVAPIVFASSGNPEFDAWRADFALRALSRGASREALAATLSGIVPDPSIVELDQRQPEFVAPTWDYVERRVSRRRIDEGRALKAEIAPILAAVEARYRVDADIIVGIWGLETSFGKAPLNYSAPAALATLAFEGRRRAQFEGYLLALIEMVEQGLAGPEEMRSSWAGALGQPQFMPDVFLSTAVDWNNDGRADIWTDRGDVAASIAKYLADHGWRENEPVVVEVVLPTGFDYALADEQSRPVAAWAELGVARIDGAPWSEHGRTLDAELYLPAGARGPALLLFKNFNVIRTYNNSSRYALVVALLARGFNGRASAFVKPWPRQEGALTREEMFELQTFLNAQGHSAGRVDGLFGSDTRNAVRAFQIRAGLPADGFPTRALLRAVRAAAPAQGASSPQ